MMVGDACYPFSLALRLGSSDLAPLEGSGPRQECRKGGAGAATRRSWICVRPCSSKPPVPVFLAPPLRIVPELAEALPNRALALCLLAVKVVLAALTTFGWSFSQY